WVNVIGEGRLVNLAAGDGHPAEIMDLSFGIQALCARYIADHRGKLEPKLYPVPAEIDREVAERKLTALGVTIDKLTDEQKAYLQSGNA
ncbi:MAG: adenosylhomocysteinase, partial [Eubacteriales bacterium]|nr:adenosylhomocysteinase [Eubacteriales bacterium]